MKSILQDNKVCFLCGAAATDEHHIFGGRNRSISEKLGLKVFCVGVAIKEYIVPQKVRLSR